MSLQITSLAYHKSLPKALLISSCMTAASPSLSSDSASHDKSSNCSVHHLEYNISETY